MAREQSLSAAGKLLRLDPATLGRRGARLEKVLRVGLLVKSPQGYALTEATGQLLEYAEVAKRAMRMATAGVEAQSDQLAGQIRIGAPDVRRILTDIFCLKRAFYLIRHQDDQRNLRLSRFAHALSSGLRAEVARLGALN